MYSNEEDKSLNAFTGLFLINPSQKTCTAYKMHYINHYFDWSCGIHQQANKMITIYYCLKSYEHSLLTRG